MHIFLIGLNTSPDHFKRAFSSIPHVGETFPDLKNGRKYFYQSADMRNFIISLTSNKISNRQYLSEDQNYITFFSGLPIDPEDSIAAHDADQLSKEFDRIKIAFEGQACLIRFNKQNNEAEIISDILGMEQVYYCKDNNAFIAGNNISFISNTIENYRLDHEGLSYFLSLGWVASDRTLIQNIRVIKGGQHWIWRDGALIKKVYSDLSTINAEKRYKINPHLGRNISKQMLKRISIISKYFEIECPLTGGYDSRILAALLTHLNVDASFYTSGNDHSDDVRIARIIAQKFQLKHETFKVDDENLIDNWDANVRNFILQNDGLISLWQLADSLINSQRHTRTLRLTAHGATAGKVIYDVINLHRGSISNPELKNYFHEKLIYDGDGFVNKEAIQYSKKYLNSFVDEYKNLNIKTVPALFFVYERVGRNHGNNWNKTRHIADSFDIFCSKYYLSTALSLSAIQKAVYPIHYQIFNEINSDLLKIPLSENRHFISQNAAAHYYTIKVKDYLKKYLHKSSYVHNHKQQLFKQKKQAFNQSYWFTKRLPEIRNIILDQSSSDLWMFLNKDKIIKSLCQPDTISIKGSVDKLYIIATLFYYQHFLSQRATNFISSTIKHNYGS